MSMKNILLIFFLFLCYNVVAQQRFPTGVPTQFSTGWFRQGYPMSDSGLIVANRDTNWLAKFSGTIVFKPSNKQFYWFDSTTLRWNQFGTVIDTTSLSNRINLKQNILSNAGVLGDSLLIGNSIKRLQNDYGLTFSTNATKILMFIDTLGSNHVVTTSQLKDTAAAIRAAIGGGGAGLTSVGLSMPSAFTVTNSPLVANGTLAVSGAGTTADYIRGNGTLATTDTGMIPNFHLKVRSLFSVTSPLTYNSTTGIFGVGDANTAGTKGVATFASSAFTDNGSGLINLVDVTTAGGCINCDITFDAKGRAISFASGTPPQFVNASGAGDTLSISDTLKRLNNGYGILHAVTANNITHSVDTSSSNSLVTQYDLTLITADNGLTKTGSNTQLGGALIQNTTIDAGSLYNLSITASGSGSPFRVTHTGSGNGVFINTFSGTGSAISAQSNNATTISAFAFGTGYGASLASTGNIGMYASTTSGVAGVAVDVNPSSTNTSQTILQLKRYTSGTAANNIAGRIEFITEPASGTVDVTSGFIESGWEDATFATRKSFMGLYTTFNGSTTRKANLSSSGQWTWDGYPALTTQVDSTTYKPIAINMTTGEIVPFGGWIGGGGSNLDVVLALGGRLTANRNVSMAHRMWGLDSSVLRLRAVDSVPLSIDLAKAGGILQFNKPEGVPRTYPGSTPFKFIMENTTDDVPTERNNPVKWGWNINRSDSSSYPGIWYSMEPNYRPGGARFIENHLEISMPNGVVKNSRLFSSTFVLGDSIASSTNTWFFSGTTWTFRNLINSVDWIAMSNGTLNINNNTSDDTELLLTNGSDEGRFTLAPGTSVLDYNGVLFRMTGELNTAVQNMTSTGRAGIRFIGDGGTTGYVIKYGSLWAAQTDLRNAMVMAAATGTPLQTSLALKADNTVWVGDIEAYTTGSQKVNINGSLALRGIGTTNSVVQFLGRTTDSTVRGVSVADAATLLGIGNTIYTGDGTLGADRNVASGGFTLRLSGANNSDTLMSIVNTGTSSVGLFSLGSLFGVDAQSTNVGLRAFGTVTGLLATGDGSEGAVIKSNTIRGATIQSVPATTNTVQEVIRLERGSTGGPGANGIGGSADFYNKLSDNSSNVSNQIISKWTNATVGSRTSQFKITGVNSTTIGDILTIDGDGAFTTYGKRIIGTTTSSAGTLTLGNSEAYIFNGTTTTWTLPAVSGTTGTIYYIKNAASGSITLNAAAAANEIYSTSAVNTYEITAGSAIILISNGTYFLIN